MRVSRLQSGTRIFIYSSFFTILSYISVLIPPEVFWPAAFMSQLIPLLLIIQFINFIILISQRNKIALIPIFTLLVGWSFLKSTFAFNKDISKNNSIKILSFNARFFREPRNKSKFSLEMIRSVTNDTSYIKCFQEYSANPSSAELDATAQMKQKGYHGFVYHAKVGDWENNPGMAIFSKFNIIDSGVVFKAKNTLNAAIFSDLDVNGKTLRVYNVHLESMSLELYGVLNIEKIRFNFRRLKYGAVKRNDQLKVLFAHTQSSPYPFILCGDFNETPYSYAYRSLVSNYKNSFEEAGNGFGFTFNEIPYLLRIDHQFYRSDIQAVGFQVNRSMNISDHFPTYGYYLMP